MKIKGTCHCTVRNAKGEIIREYDQDSVQTVTKLSNVSIQGKQWIKGGYRKRKYIYDRYDDWKTSVG